MLLKRFPSVQFSIYSILNEEKVVLWAYAVVMSFYKNEFTGDINVYEWFASATPLKLTFFPILFKVNLQCS